MSSRILHNITFTTVTGFKEGKHRSHFLIAGISMAQHAGVERLLQPSLENTICHNHLGPKMQFFINTSKSSEVVKNTVFPHEFS